MKKFVLLVISTLFLSGCNRLDNHQPLSSASLSFAKANIITQTFLSHRDNLNAVSICLKNPSRSPIPLHFALADDTNSILRELNFTGGNIDNLDCTRFQFEPIPNSANRRYLASISLNLDPTLDPKEEVLLRYGLLIQAHGGGDYLDGTASVDGIETPYDLHFKTFYFQPLKEVVAESSRQFGHRLTQDPLFFLVFLSLLGAVTYYSRIRRS